MNLLEMAQFVCSKLNQSETEDQAAAKLFLQRRYEMVWADQLWKDSLFEYTQAIGGTYTPASTWLPTRRVLILPPQIEYVVAVRTADRQLTPDSAERFYRMDYDAFSQSGNAQHFLNLPRCVWDFDTATNIYLTPNSADDDTKEVIVDYLDSDRITLRRVTSTLAADQSVLVGTALTVDRIAKAATAGDVVLGNQDTPNLFAGQLYDQPTGGAYLKSVTLTAGAAYKMVVGNSMMLYSSDLEETHTANGTFVAGKTDYVLQGPAYGGGLPAPDVAITTTLQLVSSIVTIPAADTSAEKRCRIQIVGNLPDNTTLRVLGKRTCPLLTGDNDSPALTGVENCLLAFCQSDMLERSRQYGKAATMANEAAQLLEQLKRVQTVQQAHNKRLMPADGYGSDYWVYGQPPLTF